MHHLAIGRPSNHLVDCLRTRLAHVATIPGAEYYRQRSGQKTTCGSRAHDGYFEGQRRVYVLINRVPKPRICACDLINDQRPGEDMWRCPIAQKHRVYPGGSTTLCTQGDAQVDAATETKPELTFGIFLFVKERSTAFAARTAFTWCIIAFRNKVIGLRTTFAGTSMRPLGRLNFSAGRKDTWFNSNDIRGEQGRKGNLAITLQSALP